MGIHLSLPIGHRHAAKAHEDARRRRSKPEAALEFLDRDDNRVGAVAATLPKPFAFEVPNGAGAFDRATPDLHLRASPSAVPATAVAVRGLVGGTIVGQAPLQKASAKPSRPAATASFPDANGKARWTLRLVSEHFTDAARFFGFASQLYDYIRGQPPFSTPLGDSFAIEALFWPSPPEGLFKTKQDGRLVYGDGELVNRFVAKSGVAGRLTFVLVDMPVRGGAGGVKGLPGWSTITSEAGETWEAVALHEIGHGFGLADEYTNHDQPTPEPKPLEPNVTKAPNPAAAPWAALCTPGHPGAPTCAVDPPPAALSGVVGTFQGARYRPDRYRPAATCLMRVPQPPFCPVCRDHIAKVLAAI